MVKAKIIKNLYATNILIIGISPYLNVGVNPDPTSVVRKTVISLMYRTCADQVYAK
jgi:hypothetical protein